MFISSLIVATFAICCIILKPAETSLFGDKTKNIREGFNAAKNKVANSFHAATEKVDEWIVNKKELFGKTINRDTPSELKEKINTKTTAAKEFVHEKFDELSEKLHTGSEKLHDTSNQFQQKMSDMAASNLNIAFEAKDKLKEKVSGLSHDTKDYIHEKYEKVSNKAHELKEKVSPSKKDD